MITNKIIARDRDSCPVCDDVMLIPVINHLRGMYLDEKDNGNTIITHEPCPICNDFEYPESDGNTRIIW